MLLRYHSTSVQKNKPQESLPLSLLHFLKNALGTSSRMAIALLENSIGIVRDNGIYRSFLGLFISIMDIITPRVGLKP